MGLLLLLVSLVANRCERWFDHGGCAVISNVFGIVGTFTLLGEGIVFGIWWFPQLIRGFQ